MAKVGRPKGSGSKPSTPVAHPPRPRGRPKGSVKVHKTPSSEFTPARRPRGRPKGSTKKPAPSISDPSNDTVVTTAPAWSIDIRKKSQSAIISPSKSDSVDPVTDTGVIQPSIVGVYALKCRNPVPNDKMLYMRVRAPSKKAKIPPGVFRAYFHLGVVSGEMVLSTDEKLLQILDFVESGLDSGDDDRCVASGSPLSDSSDPCDCHREWLNGKREKAKAQHPSKPRQRFYLRWRGRDTGGEQKVIPGIRAGEIDFIGDEPGCLDLEGWVDMHFGKGRISGDPHELCGTELENQWMGTSYYEEAWDFFR